MINLDYSFAAYVRRTRVFAVAAAIVIQVSAIMAGPSLSLRLERDKIYLGESVIAYASLKDADGDTPPTFSEIPAAEFEYLGSRDNSRSFIQIINGKLTRESVRERLFVFRMTPAKAGVFKTGTATINTAQGVVSAAGLTIEVTGIEARDDISASVTCENQTILVDDPFYVKLTISLRALPAPNADIEPIFPRSPLHIDAPFLDMTPIEGLKQPDMNALLNGLISRRQNQEPAFSINDYKTRGMSMGFFDFGSDPFSEKPVLFRLNPALRTSEKHGTNYWDYSIVLNYTPTQEGDYTFGPVAIKGSIVKGANRDGTPSMEEVFVIGPALTIRVVPPPEEGRPDYFIGSVGTDLKATASFDTARCKVGDPLTLSLDITGAISLSNLKPPFLSLQPGCSKDFRIYDENIETENIDGGKRFKYRVRPLTAGTLEFPPILTAFYDTHKGSYVTVATEPLPLQAEATTQIAATSTEGNMTIGESGDDIFSSAQALTPDGIIIMRDNHAPYCVDVLVRHRVSLFALPVALFAAIWLLKAGIRAAAHALSATAHRRAASGSMHELRRVTALADTDPAAAAAAATHAARAAIASLLERPAASVTVPEIRTELTGYAVPEAAVTALCDAFAALEALPYSHNVITSDGVKVTAKETERAIETVQRYCKHRKHTGATALLVPFIVLTFLSRLSATAATPPGEFDWDRANQAVVTAQTQADFLDAAKLYYSIVTNGASSGPLFYNLGTTLLLAEKPHAAIEAFIEAERWLGTTQEIADNWKLANALIDNSQSGQLPISRIFLRWHYGVDFATRILLLFGGWAVFWIGCIIALFRKKDHVSRTAMLYKLMCNILMTAGLITAIFYGATALSIAHGGLISNREFPAIEHSLSGVPVK